MIETAVVFDCDGKVIHWHEPQGRSGGSLPDSRKLWDVLWENREILGGVAHTHPWNGSANPSSTDLTTFAAIETGLGKTLVWPVVTFDEVSYWMRSGDEYTKRPYRSVMTIPDCINLGPKWGEVIQELRQRSRQGDQHG